MSSRVLRSTYSPLLAAAAALAIVVAALMGGGRARAGTTCWYGEITLSSRPLLTAPNPAHAGDTITSSGGGWATCGGEPRVSFTTTLVWFAKADGRPRRWPEALRRGIEKDMEGEAR